MKLHVSLEPGDGETPSDFVSRLATRACRDSLWDFCGDFGLDTQGIVDGEPGAVSDLADFAGVDADRLLREAFVRLNGNHRFLHRGQHLGRRNLTRDRVRVCPACLADDVACLDFRIQARPHRRSEWILGAIHTCARHKMALVDLRRGGERPSRSHETSHLLADALPRLDQILSQAARRAPSTFETYVRQRLAGALAFPWLDDLPLFAALDLVRVVGAVSLRGPKVALEALTDNETWACEAAGFGILRQGEEGVRALLDRLQSKFRHGRAAWGPKAMFGRLYEWLAHENDDPAYEPMRRIMVDYVHRTLPVGPGDTLFGREFEDRRLHSIHSASLEFNLHPKRLRKLLVGAGLVGPEARGLSDERVLVDAERASAFVREIADGLNFGEAARYLNVPRPHDRGLFNAGFFEPIVRGGRAEGLNGHVFRRHDLDAFLRELLRDARAVRPDEAHLAQLPYAAKRSCCEVVAIVRLIFERKLQTFAVLPGESGFLSIVVDVDEIRPLVVGPDHGGLNLRTVEKELRTTTNVVKYLVEKGFIRSERVPNPVHKRIQTIVRRPDLERFRAEYATLYSLARSRGFHAVTMRRKLEAAGVRPVAEAPHVKLTLYRIADVP